MALGRNQMVRLSAACALTLMAAGLLASASAAAYQMLDEPADGEHAISFKLEAPSPWPKAAEARLVFCFGDEANHYILRFARGKAALSKLKDGHESQLGREVSLPEAPAGAWGLVLSKRTWEISLACDDRTILRAYDDAFLDGMIGWEGVGGASVEDVALQPLGEIWFDDDFMRAGGEEDAWDVISGTWELRSARSAGLQPNWSANPFSYCGSAEMGGTATTGYWFWDNYRISTAVKAAGRGAIGLVCHFVDPQNYILYRWTRGEGLGDQPAVGRQQLIRVLGGKWGILADKLGPWKPNQWYELGLAVCDGRLQVTVDGQMALEADDDVLAYGKAGLHVGDCDTAYFDDVRIRDHRALATDFRDDVAGRVAAVTGEWECRQEHLYGTPRAEAKPAAAVTGSPDWRNYQATVAVKPKDARAVGIYAGYRGPEDYYLFRWGRDEREPKRFVQEILRVSGGQGRALGKRTCEYAPDNFTRLSFTIDKGYLAGSINGGPPVEAADPSAADVSGKAGLYVEGSGKTACFDDLNVSFLGDEPQVEQIVEQFTQEDSMSNWARGTALWRGVDDTTQIFETPLFGDFRLEADMPNLQGVEGGAALLLCNTEDTGQPAAVLRFASGAGENSLAATIEGQPEGLTSGPVTAAQDAPHLVIDRRGGTLLAWLDGQPLAGGASPQAADARWLALRAEGLAMDLNRVTITSPDVSDCLFSAAPTGWVSALGNWEITDRWACTPGWAWLGSSGHTSPLLLSKHTYSGDIQLDFWAALGHPYAAIGNINAALCATAPSLCSGYSFIYGGEGNTASRILRGNDVVLSTDQVLFPTNKDVYHRHWSHVRIRRFGNELSYWIDGAHVGTYADPDPLPDGRVGFWTYGDTRIVIARARIAAEQQRIAP